MRASYIILLAVFSLGCRERIHAGAFSEDSAGETRTLTAALEVFFEDPVTANTMTSEYSGYLDWQATVTGLESQLENQDNDDAKLEIADKIEALGEQYRVEHPDTEFRIESD